MTNTALLVRTTPRPSLLARLLGRRPAPLARTPFSHVGDMERRPLRAD